MRSLAAAGAHPLAQGDPLGPRGAPWPPRCRREAAAALWPALTGRFRCLWPRRHPRYDAAQRHTQTAGGTGAAPQAASRAARHGISHRGGDATRGAEAAQAGWRRGSRGGGSGGSWRRGNRH